MVRQLSRSPRYNIHYPNHGHTITDTDTHARGDKNKCPLWANASGSGRMPGRAQSFNTLPPVIYSRTIFSYFHHVHNLPYIHVHKVMPPQSYYLPSSASTDRRAACPDKCTDQRRTYQYSISCFTINTTESLVQAPIRDSS